METARAVTLVVNQIKEHDPEIEVGESNDIFQRPQTTSSVLAGRCRRLTNLEKFGDIVGNHTVQIILHTPSHDFFVVDGPG